MRPSVLMIRSASGVNEFELSNIVGVTVAIAGAVIVGLANKPNIGLILHVSLGES